MRRGAGRTPGLPPSLFPLRFPRAYSPVHHPPNGRRPGTLPNVAQSDVAGSDHRELGAPGLPNVTPDVSLRRLAAPYNEMGTRATARTLAGGEDVGMRIRLEFNLNSSEV